MSGAPAVALQNDLLKEETDARQAGCANFAPEDSTYKGTRSSDAPYVSMEGGGIGALDAQKRYDEENEEGDEDDKSYAPSIASTVLTADGVADPEGFFIICFVILIGDMSRGVMFPTMWPLVESLGGTPITLGYAVAAFSFGRILVSPLFGSWSISHGYKKTLLLSCSILLLGTLTYAQVVNVGRPEFLIVAQTILGVGSGTLGVTRAFVAEITPKRDRTTYLAWITSVQYAGFTVTPIFGALFTKIFQNENAVVEAGIFVLNMYTAPAYFMSLLCVLTLFLLSTRFRDRQRHTAQKKGPKSRKRTEIDELANSTTFIGLTVYDACLLGCMLLNVSTKGSIACFETMGISFAESHFDMYSARAGTIVGFFGAMGVVSLLCMGQIAKYLTDIQMISGGMIIMALSSLSLSSIHGGEDNPNWRYVVAIFMMYSVGYPIGHTAVMGLFSKIVGRRPQGTLQGWFASAGSFARIIFPVMSGYIANYTDVSTLFLVLFIILSVSTMFVSVNRETLTKLSL